MFKLTAFILSFTILAQSASFDIIDITKFSTFFTHINNHIDEGDDFADFIDLHYGNKIDLHQNKHKEHKELPFKHQHIDSNFQFVFVLYSHNLNISSPENRFKLNNFNYKEPTSNLYINNFFQPPQK